MKKVMCVLFVVCLGVMVSGCASSRSGQVFGRDQARVGHRVEMGVITAINEGKIEGTKTPIGAAAGGVMGGVLGRSVGGGTGQDIATVAGALAGAAAGAVAEEKITQRKALEITVNLDSGQVVAVVQEADEVFNVGDRVRVLTGPDGTKRVRH
jgi:outer membrane lipoprotein SlyB